MTRFSFEKLKSLIVTKLRIILSNIGQLSYKIISEFIIFLICNFIEKYFELKIIT